MKKSEISNIELNRLFRKAKKGFIKIEQWMMDNFFTVSGYYGYDDNSSVEDMESWLNRILEAVNNKDYEEAQKLIDILTNSHYKALSLNKKNEVNRNLVA